MKIAILSSWGCRCGIASYTKFLTDSLVELGHEVIILCQYKMNDDHEDFDDDKYNIVRCWEWYGKTNKVDFNLELIKKTLKEFEAEVLHIQYESFLYHQSYLKDIKSNLDNIKLVITHHSSCTGPDCPINDAINIVHDHEFVNLPNRHVVPMGIPNLKPITNVPQYGKTFGSFGLARNNDEMAQKSVENLKKKGIFDVNYITHYGNSKWVSMDELASIIKKWRAVVLLYPPSGANVSSSAVCVAIGTGVPVICTDTRWFKHAKDYVHLIGSQLELDFLLEQYLNVEEYWWEDHFARVTKALNERSWKIIAEKHIDIYKEW